MTTINSTEILQKTDQLILKLHDKLRPVGWYHPLQGLLNSTEFHKIIYTLVSNSVEDKKFTPIIKDLFRAFELTPYNNLRVIMVGQDPYPQLGVANGVSFCCANKPDNKMEASLRYISEAIHRTVYECDESYVPSNDLSRWSKQGVLMLNTALTTDVGQIGKHQELWKPFTQHIIDTLNHSNSGLIWVFLGKQAQQYGDLVSETTHHKLYVSHPASAAYAKQKQWDCLDMFNRINSILHATNGENIVW